MAEVRAVNDLYLWINRRAWRWRTVHLLVACGLELCGFGWGVVAYTSHEWTQAPWPFVKWSRDHTDDLLTAYVGALLGNIPRFIAGA